MVIMCEIKIIIIIIITDGRELEYTILFVHVNETQLAWVSVANIINIMYNQ